jgi:hypothetical protein
MPLSTGPERDPPIRNALRVETDDWCAPTHADLLNKEVSMKILLVGNDQNAAGTHQRSSWLSPVSQSAFLVAADMSDPEGARIWRVSSYAPAVLGDPPR